MKKKPLREILSALVFCSVILTGFVFQPAGRAVAAPSLDYNFSASKSTVNAGENFSITIKLTDNSAQPFYNISVYFYQGNAIDHTTVQSTTPAYNANFENPELAQVYNPKYWTKASISAGSSANFKAVYSVSSDAPEGRLKTLGYTTITQGSDVSEAEQNKVSEMLIDVEYYIDNSGQESSKRTIRGYIDLPSVNQPSAEIASKTLPRVFSTGEKTTDLSSIKQNEAEEYKNFTLDTEEGNKIIWRDAIDLTTSTVLARMENIDTYVFITAPGLISVDPTMAPFFDTGAQIVYKNVSFVTVPTLLKDGDPVSDEIQSTGICDLNTKTCSFMVDGFSEYKFKPSLTIELPDTTNERQFQLEGTVDDLEAVVEFKLNNAEWKEIGEVDIETALFKRSIVLSEGENTIQVRAASENDEEDVFSAVINYDPSAETSAEDEASGEEEKTPNVLLNILGISLIVVAVVLGVVMWVIIYRRKKEKKSEKVKRPKDIQTRVLSKDRVKREKQQKPQYQPGTSGRLPLQPQPQPQPRLQPDRKPTEPEQKDE